MPQDRLKCRTPDHHTWDRPSEGAAFPPLELFLCEMGTMSPTVHSPKIKLFVGQAVNINRRREMFFYLGQSPKARSGEVSGISRSRATAGWVTRPRQTLRPLLR